MGSFSNEEHREEKEGKKDALDNSFLPFEAPRNAERNLKTTIQDIWKEKKNLHNLFENIAIKVDMSIRCLLIKKRGNLKEKSLRMNNVNDELNNITYQPILNSLIDVLFTDNIN
uniref:Uncharacterized protein n=1 Tax=Wuchereria bancrofti TaxID=6293 RepID=A0AAF5PW52_WUCBA